MDVGDIDPDWLRQEMAMRNITPAELARRIEDSLDKRGFSPVNISHYLSGRSKPRPQVRTAILEILQDASFSKARHIPRRDNLSVRDGDDGSAILSLNMSLPWPLAIKILALVSGGQAKPAEQNEALSDRFLGD
jgi:hypothetical protein